MKSKIFKILVFLFAITIALDLYFYYRVPPKINLSGLTLENLEGQKIDNGLFEGKLLVLSFYQSWCGPCIGEMNSLEELSVNFKDEILVLCVSDEEIEKQKNVAIRFSRGNIYFLNTKVPFKEIGIHTFPTNYVFDKNGVLKYEKTAPEDWSSEKMIKQINEWKLE